MKKILSFVLAITLLITAFAEFGAVEANAAVGINQISLETSENGFKVGDYIKVNIKASNINDLYGIQFTLQYDPSYLELIGITSNKTSTPAGIPLELKQFVKNEKTNGSLKEITYAFTQSVTVKENVFTGTLAEAYIGEITFKAKAEGHTDIVMDNTYALGSDESYIRHYSPKSSLTVQIGGTVPSPVVTTIVINGEEKVIAPVSGNVAIPYAANVKDQFGISMPSEQVKWSIDGTVTGISVDADTGAVTVNSTVSVTSFKLRATSVSNISVSAATTVLVEKDIIPAPEVTSIVINGASKITIPSNGNTNSQYSAVVKDKDGTSMPAEKVTWSIDGTVSGVSVDGNSGVATVKSTATAGTFTLKATSVSKSSVSATKIITLENAAVTPPPVIIPGDTTGGTSTTILTQAELVELFKKIQQGNGKEKTAEIELQAVQGCSEYIAQVPVQAFTSNYKKYGVRIITPLGSVVIHDGMFTTSQLENAVNFGVSIKTADTSGLSDNVKTQIGNRPVVELKALIDGKVVQWNNPKEPVQVSIPYTPTAGELGDYEHIVVWYIDGSGKAVSVPNGRYDPDTGLVTFSTTHFSRYAVALVYKTFSDISAYKGEGLKSIEVLASKGVIEGITSTEYSPEEPITRADFLLYLVRGLGLTAAVDSNFEDVKETDYYYEAVGIAKALGITNGNGNNQFRPDKSISRQDMMVMVRRALNVTKKITASAQVSELDKFKDSVKVAKYAKESVATLVRNGIIKGGNKGINPQGEFRRGEAAMVIYRLYNMK